MQGRTFTYSCSLEDWECVPVASSAVLQPCTDKFDDAFLPLEKSLQNSVDRDSQLAKFQLKGHSSKQPLVESTAHPRDTNKFKTTGSLPPKDGSSLPGGGSVADVTVADTVETTSDGNANFIALVAEGLESEERWESGEAANAGQDPVNRTAVDIQNCDVKGDVSVDTLSQGSPLPSSGRKSKGIPNAGEDTPVVKCSQGRGGIGVPTKHMMEVYLKNWDGLDAFELPIEEGESSALTTPNRATKPRSTMNCSPGFSYSPVDKESPPEAAAGGVGVLPAKELQCHSLPSQMPPPASTSFVGPHNVIQPPPGAPSPNQSTISVASPPPSSVFASANTAPALAKTVQRSNRQDLTQPRSEPRMPQGGVQFLYAGGKNPTLSAAQMSRAAALFADINDDASDCLHKGNSGKRGRDEATQEAMSGGPQSTGLQQIVGMQIKKEHSQQQQDKVCFGQDGQVEGGGIQRAGLFQMASGKVARVSMESTNRARALMDDQEDDYFEGRNPKGQRLSEAQKSPGIQKHSPSSCRPNDFLMLNTSVGGPVRISNTKLEAAQSMLGPPLQSCLTAPPGHGCCAQGLSGQASQVIRAEREECGFSFPRLETGAGRQVDVSKSGIQRVKARLGLPVSGVAAVSGEKRQGSGTEKDSRLQLSQHEGLGAESTPSTPPPQSSHFGDLKLTASSGKVPSTPLAALTSLTPVLRPKLRGGAHNERRAFAKPRRSLEGPIGPPTKHQGKSRRSWQPLVPSNAPGTLHSVQMPESCQHARHPVHDLYEGESRCTITEHFGKIPQAASVLTVGPDEARNFVFSDGKSVDALRSEMVNCGCDPDYASEQWCKNHFQWIVWKLASHDSVDGGCSLTPTAVLDELKYRYEVEYGQGNRSILHMIFEQDRASSRPMVLLVSRIHHREGVKGRALLPNQGLKVELTDGWYPIIAHPDGLLTKLIEKGGISVGDKLRISGASLVAARPDEPLEAVNSSTLRFHYNGCHPVPWDEPLGIHQREGLSSIISLGLVEPNGGPISRTLVCIVRRYPLMYWGKLPSGTGISRTPRSWERARKSFREAAASIEAEVQAEVQQRVLVEVGNAIAAGGGIVEKVAYDMLREGGSSDCGVELTADQKQELARYLEDRQAQMQVLSKTLLQQRLERSDVQEVQGFPYIRLMVNGVHFDKENVNDVQSSAIIKVWRPSEDSSALQEGWVYDIANLNVTGKSNGTLELSTQASTKWEFVANHTDLPGQLAVKFHPRRRVTLLDLVNAPIQQRPFDFLGWIVYVGHLIGDVGGWNFQQWVFLVDETIGSGDMPMLLAVRLSGCAESVDFLEHGTDRGVMCLFKDIKTQEVDLENGLLVAASSEFSSHEFIRFKQRGDNGALEEWVGKSKGLIDRLTDRIGSLVSKG